MEVSSCSCHLKKSVYVYGLGTFSDACRTAAYSQFHIEHMLVLHFTDECLEQSFICFSTLLRILMN